MHDFNARKNDARAPEILEAHHRHADVFDGAVILLDDAVQVLVLPDPDRPLPLGVDGLQRARLAPLLSTVITSGSPFRTIALSK
jgi:hypothetical protein